VPKTNRLDFDGDPEQDSEPGFLNPDQDLEPDVFPCYVWQVDSRPT